MAANYEKSVFRQLEDEIKAHEESKARIGAMSIEISKLKDEMAAVQAKHEDDIQQALKAAVEEAVKKASEPLIQEIMRLKAIIEKGSSTSSKPPSSDGFKKTKSAQNSREKTGKKAGAQKGHKGHKLELPDNIDELIANGSVAYNVVEHGDCNGAYTSKYEVGIQIKATITEHRYPDGSKVPPEHANSVFYGDSVKALAILLNNGGFVAYERLGELIGQLTNGLCEPSEGMLAALMPSFAKKLEGELEAIKQALVNSAVLNTDETPMSTTQKMQYAKCGKAGCGQDNKSCSMDCGEPEIASTEGKGETMQAYARTYSSPSATLYKAQARKDAGGVLRDGILPNFIGTLSHDHDIKMYRLGSAHSTCCPHLCRELKGLEKLYNIEWAEQAQSFFYKMNSHKKADLQQGRSECSPEALEAFMAEYGETVLEGWEAYKELGEKGFGASNLAAILKRLETYKDSYTLFIRGYSAPFSNNLAERDLRMVKAKLKISGCFRSWVGLESFLTIRSFISTVRKRGLGVLESIEKVLKGESALAF